MPVCLRCHDFTWLLGQSQQRWEANLTGIILGKIRSQSHVRVLCWQVKLKCVTPKSVPGCLQLLVDVYRAAKDFSHLTGTGPGWG